MFDIVKFVNSNNFPVSLLYFNTINNEIIDRGLYMETLPEERKRILKLPRWKYEDQDNIIRDFLKIKCNELQIKDFYSNYFTNTIDSFLGNFHSFAEDYHIWDCYLTYRAKVSAIMLVEWCKKNNIKYSFKENEIE